MNPLSFIPFSFFPLFPLSGSPKKRSSSTKITPKSNTKIFSFTKTLPPGDVVNILKKLSTSIFGFFFFSNFSFGGFHFLFSYHMFPLLNMGGATHSSCSNRVFFAPPTQKKPCARLFHPIHQKMNRSTYNTTSHFFISHINSLSGHHGHASPPSRPHTFKGLLKQNKTKQSRQQTLMLTGPSTEKHRQLNSS
jgi:hypothetical protein